MDKEQLFQIDTLVRGINEQIKLMEGIKSDLKNIKKNVNTIGWVVVFFFLGSLFGGVYTVLFGW